MDQAAATPWLPPGRVGWPQCIGSLCIAFLQQCAAAAAQCCEQAVVGVMDDSLFVQERGCLVRLTSSACAAAASHPAVTHWAIAGILHCWGWCSISPCSACCFACTWKQQCALCTVPLKGASDCGTSNGSRRLWLFMPCDRTLWQAFIFSIVGR